jgi:hypothetical protein
VSLRETLEGLLKRCKKPEKRAKYEAQLTSPPYPKALGYLLNIFYRLRRRKASYGYGPVQVEWPDIDAFLRHSRINLSSWEIEILEDLDDLYLAERNGKHDENGND